MGYDIDFGDLTAKKMTVRIGDKDYEIREATGEDSVKFRNRIQASIIYQDGKPAGFKNLAGTEGFLVSLCTYDSQGKRVSEDAVSAWPARVISRLFKEIQRISELTTDTETQDLLYRALEDEDSPISYTALKEYVSSLPEEYAPLQAWLNSKEAAKNALGATTVG